MTGPADFTLASYNIRKAIGRDGRRDPERVLAVVAALEADIVVLQEADFRFRGRKAVFDAAAIPEITGLMPIDVAPEAPGLGWHGNMLLLRPGIVAVSVAPLELPGLEPRGAVLADLDVGGLALRVIHTHLGLVPRQRRRQAALLAGRMAETGPTVLAGDLNAWSARRSLGPLGPALLPVALGPTFPTRMPTIRFDRIYHSRTLEVLEASVHDSALARIASDHLPVRARLRFDC